MLDHQVLDFDLGRIIQGIIGGTHVGKLGVAARRRDDTRREQRIFRWNRLIRGIGMPEAITQVKGASSVIAPEQLIVLVEIGNVAYLNAQPTFFELGNVRVQRRLDISKPSAEGKLLLVVQRLIMKN